MRHALVLFFLLAAAPVSAQTEAESAWSEVQQRAAEVAATQDCRVACRALESLSRATKKLCDIGPDHCEEARAKLRDATARVRATCPECEVKTTVEPKATNPPPAPPSYAGSDTVAKEEAAAPSKSGGCAGCGIASRAEGSIGLLALALLALRRKKNRR